MIVFYPLLCYYPSEAGGPANTLYWLNKSIGKKGVNSFILSTKYGLPKGKIEVKELYDNYNINVDFVDNAHIDFFTTGQLRKVRLTDVVHFSSLFFAPTLFLLFYTLILGKGIIISPRGELYPAALARKPVVKRVYLYCIKFFQKKIIFHSTNNFETGLIREYFPLAKSIVQVPNYIDLPEKHYVTKRNQILFLGRINPIKNIDVLIKAYAQLPDKVREKYKLVIAGEAKLEYEKDYLITLKNLTNKMNLADVEFIGGIYKAEKEKLLAESYCTVLPSKSENFGNVVLESLAQGTPVIVSTGAPWDIIDKYEIGYWVRPTVDQLRDALDKLLNLEESAYLKLCSNSLNVASELFDIDQNINVWIDIYNQSIK